MTERDREYLVFFDALLERCLCRITGPARDHFVNLRAKIPALLRMTNAENEALILGGVRRLVKSGRVTRATRCFAGRTVHGIICLPRRAWKQETASDELDLTNEDTEFLKRCGVAVTEPVLA
jgi:hypothetical protein